MALTEGIHVVSPKGSHLERILSGIVYLHGDCIINDNTMAKFLPPLSYDRILQRWRSVFDQVTANQRVIMIHVSHIKDRSPETEGRKEPFPSGTVNLEGLQNDGLEISGQISLHIPVTETGSFRGEIASFVVAGFHKERGIGRKLMAELEAQALKHVRWHLMLDTTVGTPAEKIYTRLGWTRLGVVKDYRCRPTVEGDEVELADGVWFWKDLRGQK